MVYYDGSYQASIVDSLQGLWYKIISYLPNFIAAVIVLLLGWLVGEFLHRVVLKVLEAVKVDTLANRLGMDHLSERTGRKLSIAKLGAWLVKWFFLIGAFIAASDILGLTQVSVFLYGKVFPYFGNVIVAVAILLIGVVAANFLSDLVRGTLAAGQIGSKEPLAAITKWSIMIFAVLAALSQLDIAASFLQSLFMGVVAMLAIAGGIAFGMGGRDLAKKILDKIDRDFM